MTRHLLTTGSTFEVSGAYSRAVVQKPFCFMSGVTGYDYSTIEISDDLEAQARRIFGTIERVLKEVLFDLDDVVSMVFTLNSQSDWPAVYDIMNEKMAKVRPTLFTYIAQLIEPTMKVVIQVTGLCHPKSADQ